jgi:protein-disulfide isomerase
MDADLSSAPVPALSSVDHVRGPASAPLLLVYADFTCPHCALAHARLRGAPLRVAFRHFALRSRHPRSVPLACAAEAAGLQGRFWEFHDELFADPARIDDPHLWARARRLGLDVDRFESDRRSDAVAQRITEDVRAALRAGVTTTPTLFAGGVAYPGAPDATLVALLTHGATG